jgi:O-antigen ligase
MEAAASAHPFLQRSDSATGIAGFLVFSYCVFRLGGVHEFLAMHGLVTHYNYFFVPVLFLLVFLEGRFLRVLKHPAAIWLTGFQLWMAATTVTSSWRGGSIQILQTFFQDEYVLFLALGAAIMSVTGCRRFLASVSVAMCFLVGFGLLSGSLSGLGRFMIEGSKYGNPNDFAFHLLFCGSFLFCFLATKKDTVQATGMSVVVGVAFLVAIFLFFETGSRGGLITLAVMAALGWLRLRFAKKMIVTVISIACILIAPFALPRSTMARYSTLFGDEPQADEMNAQDERNILVAEASTDARKNTFWLSVSVTMEHPILGVGPGEFADVVERAYKAMHRFRNYTGTHNSFTQASSEMGVPGFLLFIGVLWSSYSSLKKTRKATRGIPELVAAYNLAWATTFALVAFIVGSLFAQFAYTTYMPMIAALSVGLSNTVAESTKTT